MLISVGEGSWDAAQHLTKDRTALPLPATKDQPAHNIKSVKVKKSSGRLTLPMKEEGKAGIRTQGNGDRNHERALWEKGNVKRGLKPYSTHC